MLVLILKFVALFAIILVLLIPQRVKKPIQGVKVDRSVSDFP
jgi:hypothetical protein